MGLKIGVAALATATAICLSVGSASAADMRQPVYKAAPMAAPGFNWTGFYLGAVGGYAWGDADTNLTGTLGVVGFAPGKTKPDGWLAGGTVGYNYQQGNLVLGTEGEFYWSDLEGSAGSALPVPFTATYSNNWTGTLSTRLGVAFDTLLVYSKAGVAWANNDYNLSSTLLIPGGYSSTVSDTETGWLVGGGVEWAFARNWSAKIEGTYMDFGQKNRSFAPLGGAGGIPVNADIDAQISTIKFGVNYRFY